jgi:hypothetical protein
MNVRSASWSYAVLRAESFDARHWALSRLDSTERNAPEWVGKTPQYRSGKTRLLASATGYSILTSQGISVEAVRTPGFIGIIEIDSLKLEPSRNRAIAPDISAVLLEAKNAVKESVVENLNALGEQSLIVGKTKFLESCARYYGEQTVIESTVPWISHLTYPGNIQLIDRQTFLQMVATCKSVFIAFNSGPWTTLKQWEGVRSTDKELAFLIEKGNYSPQYQSDKAIGSIVKLWDKWHNLSLFSIFVRSISEAWQMSPERLVNQEGWSLDNTALMGKFTRSSSS